jgi:putative PIN family toxin of toxin-antitoxin system
LEDVLSRPKLVKQIRLSGLTSAELTRTYLDVAAILEPIAVDGIAPDPDDDAVIGTAIAANADLLVTGDKGLLSVGSYKGCRIVSVQAAMDELMAY